MRKLSRNRINESMGGMSALPEHLLNDIRNGNTPLSDNPSFINGLLEKLSAKRYAQIKAEFSDDIESYSDNKVLTELGRLITLCKKEESGIKAHLEKLISNILVDLFNIPEDGVKIEYSLVDEIPRGKTFHIYPDTDEEFQYDSVSDIEMSDDNTKKRKLLNAISAGIAIDVAKQAMKKNIGEIFELNDNLPKIYGRIMRINDYLIFKTPYEIKDNSHKQGGYVEVKLGSNGTPTVITAKGVIFPILLIEVIKGCVELWASAGLPDDVEKAKSVINKADALENEPWYTRIGPMLWQIMESCTEIDTKYLPSFIHELCRFDNEDFFSLMKEVFAGTKEGANRISSIYNHSKRDDDYSSFEDDILKKQSEKSVIEDDYFSDDELKSWQ